MMQRRAFLGVLGVFLAHCGAGTATSEPPVGMVVTASFLSATLANDCPNRGEAGAARDCADEAPRPDAGSADRAPPQDAAQSSDASNFAPPPSDGGAGVPVQPRDAGGAEPPEDGGGAPPLADAGTGLVGNCGTGYCQQSAMRLQFVAGEGLSPATVEVVSVRLLDAATGALLDNLTAREPSAWSDASSSYQSWDRAVAPRSTVRAQWKLSAPNWSALSAIDVRYGYARRVRLEITVRIDGAVQTVRSGELFREPEVVT